MDIINLAKNEFIYALDFDGVIADSAIETSITGWKVAQKLWRDMPDTAAPQQYITDFRQVRPFLETGYEAILIMRLLQQGISTATLCNHYAKTLDQLIYSDNLNINTLKKLFGETRDHWIEDDLEEWLSMNPLFRGIQQALKQLEDKTWYIITTKQERFVKKILQANSIELKGESIYGMDSRMTKTETLLELMKKHPHQSIVFIEDRLPTLVNINKNKQLQTVKLQLATWGYNTSEDKANALKTLIQLIKLDEFLSV